MDKEYTPVRRFYSVVGFVTIIAVVVSIVTLAVLYAHGVTEVTVHIIL